MTKEKPATRDWTAMAARVNKLARERRRLRERLERLDAENQRLKVSAYAPSKVLGVAFVTVAHYQDGSVQVEVTADPCSRSGPLEPVIPNDAGQTRAYFEAFVHGNSAKAMNCLEKLGALKLNGDLVFYGPLGEYLEKVGGKWRRVR